MRLKTKTATAPVNTCRQGAIAASICKRQATTGFGYVDFTLSRSWRTAASDDHEPPFSNSHVFNASREKVWEAWTEQEHLLRWFGPKGSTMLYATVDLHVGGTFHYCMSHPNGTEMWVRWVFRTINRPDRLEFIISFSNASGEITPAPFQGPDDFPPETWTTVTLVEHAGKSRGTLVTIEARPFNGTKVQRDFFTAFHGSMRQGWAGALQQLSEFLGD